MSDPGLVATDMTTWFARRLWAGRHSVLLATFIGAAVVAIGSEMLPAKYRAVAELLIDPRDLVVHERSVIPGSTVSDAGAHLVDNHVQVIRSDAILQRVVAEQSLASDPEFIGERQSHFRRSLRWLIAHLDPSHARSRTAPSEHIAVVRLRESLTVFRFDRTFVVQIGVKSSDADKSRRLLKSIIDAYLGDLGADRARIAKRVGAEVDMVVEPLRRKLAEVESRAHVYKREHGIIEASGRLDPEQQLTELNSRLVAAKAELERAKARRAAIAGAGRDIESIPEIVTSETLQGLRGQLAVVAANRRSLDAQFTSTHPRMRAVAEEEGAIKWQIASEIERIRSSVELAVIRAAAMQDELAAAIGTLKQRMNTANSARIRQRELDGELAAVRSAYQASLSRIREAGEQARHNTANVRVIAAPRNEGARMFPPPVWFNVILGMLSGLSVMAAVIWLREAPRRGVRARQHSLGGG